MTTLLALPDELIRKILTNNGPSVLIMSVQTNKYIYKLKLHKLVMPVGLECLFNIGDKVEYKEREDYINSHALYTMNLVNKFNTNMFTFKSQEFQETISKMIGDFSKYDDPHYYYKRTSSNRKWKELGFNNWREYEKYYSTNKTRSSKLYIINMFDTLSARALIL